MEKEFIMINVKSVFENLKEYGNFSTIKAMIDELDMSRDTYGSCIKQNSLSIKTLSKIVEFCAKNNIDLNSIFLDVSEFKEKKKVNVNVVEKLNYLESEINQLRREIRV